MSKKSFILVIILSFHVERLYCGKAIVPFQVCEKYIDIPLTYTFNTTVNNSVFKNPEYLLSLIQKRASYSPDCVDSILNVAVTRTLQNQRETIGNYVITANYTVTVGIKEAYRYNYSVLTDRIADKIDECFDALIPILLIDYSIPVNISGKMIEPDFEGIQERRRDEPCMDSRYFGCHSGSVEVNKMCECSQGWYLQDVSFTKCTRCPKNTYQEKTGMFNCTQCEQGYTTLSETGRTNRAACKFPECDSGYYFNMTTWSCVQCPRNTTQENKGQKTCNDCPLDRPITEKEATVSQTDCIGVCQPGSYFNKTFLNCTPCEKTTYQPSPGTSRCLKCPDNQTTFEMGSTRCVRGVETGKDLSALAIALPICLVVAAIIAVVVFLVFRRKMKKEREAKDREDFEKNFIYQTPPNNGHHVTTNHYYSPDNSEEEGTEDDEISTLGHLAEDVAKRNLEIPRDCITMTSVRLGRGQFGEVKQALVRKPDEPEILCAAKMARGSRIPLEDMLDELEIHLKLEDKHENVVNLIGVCSSGGPFYLIIEYCDNGSLIDYLRKHESTAEYVNIMAEGVILSLEWKLSRTLEICNGMKYLAKHKIVHRDLAARNVLLDSNTVAKISDFGMAKDVYLKSFYTQQRGGCFPLRWMAMESIKSLAFNEKTDVWSFGVLVWEIFTNGDLPYYDIINDEKVALYILSGKKLTQPDNCPKFLYTMMLRCWSNKSYNRPKFAELHHSLNEHIQKQPKRGPRRFSRDILKRFEESSINLKRKMSRKSSRNSVDPTEPHTSSRRPSRDSLDRLSNDMELQSHEHPEKVSDVNTAPKKEDENRHVDTLDKIEENKLKQYSDNEDRLRNSSHRSRIDEAPCDSSNTNEIGSPLQNKNPNIRSSINEEIPTISSKQKMSENDIKDVDGGNNSEMNLSLNTDEGSEEIGNLQHGVDDDSTTDLTGDWRKGSPDLMSMMDDVLGVDQHRRDSGNQLDSKDLPKSTSDQYNNFQDFPISSNTTEENTLPKTGDDSSQSSEDNPTDIKGIAIDERPKTDISHTKTPEEAISTIPKGEPCLTTDLDDLSDDSSETLGDITDAQHKMTNDSFPESNLNKNEDGADCIVKKPEKDVSNEESSADKEESEDEQSSSDGSDFLSDVLNAVNVSKNDDTEFAPAQNETGEQGTANSSSC